MSRRLIERSRYRFRTVLLGRLWTRRPQWQLTTSSRIRERSTRVCLRLRSDLPNGSRLHGTRQQVCERPLSFVRRGMRGMRRGVRAASASALPSLCKVIAAAVQRSVGGWRARLRQNQAVRKTTNRGGRWPRDAKRSIARFAVQYGTQNSIASLLLLLNRLLDLVEALVKPSIDHLKCLGLRFGSHLGQLAHVLERLRHRQLAQLDLSG